MNNTRSPSPPPPPPAAPWAFANVYAQDLPQTKRFDPSNGSGFSGLHTFVGNQAAARGKTNPPRVNPHIATYKDRKHKDSFVNMPGLDAQERAAYEAGATAPTAVRDWVSSGSVGVVCSSLTNAADLATKNDWHCVGMARLGEKVWVHDPAYNPEDHHGNVKRVEITGNTMTHQLVQHWNTVRQVHFQGPPPEYLAQPGQMECMGRSAQWVEATVNGTLPWPPDSNSSGGQWYAHYKN